eukprot:TRINITY_DN6128_c0_g1_i1.p1 TRINITY_DN6128_c0_g1~~TRINITY_DN6128_c0_g1_i1.p1  ORF type:complete len:354 (-),score=42.54 TRINITY_DN6128_c0_g1_i1:362-1423(-)
MDSLLKDKVRVEILLIGGRNLASKDRNGFSDPFAVIEAPGMKEMKTAIVKKNLNPTWNYRWVQEAESRDHFTAHVTVYDDDLIGKDYMGEVDLLLPSDLLHQESRVLQVPLKAKGKHVKDEVAGFLTFEVKIDNTIKGLVTDALAGVDLTVDPSQVEKLSINSSGSRGCQLITTITSKLAPHKWSLASVAIDSEDRIILVDNESHAVQIFDAAGNETSNFPSALRYPHLSVNASGGCIYLADSEDGTLDKFDVSGNHLGNTAQRQAFLNVIAALSNGGVATHTFEGIQVTHYHHVYLFHIIFIFIFFFLHSLSTRFSTQTERSRRRLRRPRSQGQDTSSWRVLWPRTPMDAFL